MKISDKGLVELIGHEGIALTKYNDLVGKGYTKMPNGRVRKGTLTIGSGFTKTDIPDLVSWPWDKKMTMVEVFELKAKAIKRYENAISDALKVEVEQHVFDALVSWCYNVGVGWAGKYGHSQATCIKRLNRGESMRRVAEALMRFNKPKAIIGRRAKEARLLEYGVYSNNGGADLIPVYNGVPVYRKAKRINVWEYIDKKNDIEETPVPPEPSLGDKSRIDENNYSSIIESILNFIGGGK